MIRRAMVLLERAQVAGYLNLRRIGDRHALNGSRIGLELLCITSRLEMQVRSEHARQSAVRRVTAIDPVAFELIIVCSYTPSDGLYLPQLRPITYPEHFEVRRVSTNGGTRWNRRWVTVSHILATLPVGLEPLASGTWNLFFGRCTSAGWISETIAFTTTEDD